MVFRKLIQQIKHQQNAERKTTTSFLKTVSEWGKKYKCKLDCDVISGKVVKMW